jgi:phosphatidylglycerol lysyltransferase
VTRPEAPLGHERAPRWRKLLAGLAAIVVILWAISSLYTQFGQTTIAELRHAFELQTGGRIAASIALTFTSFGCLALYDLLAARVVARSRVPARAALLAGFAGNALSNTLGFHAITGIVARLRIYGRFGLHTADVLRIVALSWLALGLGFATMVAVAELATPSARPGPSRAVLVGAAITVCLVGFVAWLWRRPRTVSMRGFRQPLPSGRLAAAQMLIGAVESAASVGALYVLLPTDLALPFVSFSIGCIAAVALGLLSHSPGGIGVFEAAVTTMLAGAGRSDLLAALLLYRAVYNLLPFVLAAAALGGLALMRPAAGQFEAG